MTQDLAEVEEQSDISQLLRTSGTLYVLETHDLPNIVIYRSSRKMVCEIVILRFLAGPRYHQTMKSAAGWSSLS